MKSTTLAALMAAVSLSSAAETPCEHPVLAAPNGGKVLEAGDIHVEFLVQPDRTVRVTFLDKAMNPVPAADRSVAVTAQAPSGSTKLEFEPKEGAFVSKSPLPDGDGYTIVLQIKAAPDGKSKNFRILLNLADCGTCKHKEYACICESH
jgi:hypothetical protein